MSRAEMRVRPPRKLRFTSDDGTSPGVGDYLQFCTGTSYEILMSEPGRSAGVFNLVVWRLPADDIPAGAKIIPTHWIKRSG